MDGGLLPGAEAVVVVAGDDHPAGLQPQAHGALERIRVGVRVHAHGPGPGQQRAQLMGPRAWALVDEAEREPGGAVHGQAHDEHDHEREHEEEEPGPAVAQRQPQVGAGDDQSAVEGGAHVSSIHRARRSASPPVASPKAARTATAGATEPVRPPAVRSTKARRAQPLGVKRAICCMGRGRR